MNYTEIENDKSAKKSGLIIIPFIRINKFPLLITLGFSLSMFYVFSIHSLYWTHYDGIYYLRAGEQILAGNATNVTLYGATPGGPILFAFLNSFIHDGLFTEKIVALLSGTGIVFVTYFVMRNFVAHKIALVGQLFVAFNPRLNLLSITALNELLPLFLIFTSLYFVTKKDLRISSIVIAGSVLGVASIFRYQSMIVLFAVIIFLLIRNNEIKKNLLFSTIIGITFLIMFVPVIIFNYSTYGILLDSNSITYLTDLSKYQTSEWREKMTQLQLEGNQSIISAVTVDPSLFIKNYVYNLFYYNSSLLYNFNLLNNISIIPIIPFIGFIPIAVTLVYVLREKLQKSHIIVSIASGIVTTFFVLMLGDIQIHFFAIIIIPIISICIMNIKNFEKNFLLLLILGFIFMLSLSIIPAYRSYHLFTMWIPLILMNAIFFMEILPKILTKIMRIIKLNPSTNDIKIITAILIVMLVLVNLGFSYKLMESTFYSSNQGNNYTILNILQNNNLIHRGNEIKEVTEILSKQPGIENSFLMGSNSIYSYYVNSKFIYTYFNEGPANDAIDNFITRKNWTPIEISFSNANSYPSSRLNSYAPIPDYLIYTPYISDPNTPWYAKTTPEYLTVLSNPTDPRIPSNFKLIYHSNQTDVIVYKIHHEK